MISTMRFIVVLIVAVCVSVSARHVRYVPVAYNVPVRVIYDDFNSPRVVIPSRRHLERNIDQQPAITLYSDKPAQIDKESNIVEEYVKPDGSPLVANNDRAPLLNEAILSSPTPNKPQDFESNEIIANKEELENLRRVVGHSEDHIAQAPSVEKQLLSGEATTTNRPAGWTIPQVFSGFINQFTGNRNATTNSTSTPSQLPNPIAAFTNTVTNATQNFQNFINRFTGGNRNASSAQINNTTPAAGLGIPASISNAAQSFYNTITGNRTQADTSSSTNSTTNRPLYMQIIDNIRPVNIIQRLNSTFVNPTPAPATQTRTDEILKNAADSPDSVPAEIKPSGSLPEKLETQDKPTEESIKPQITEEQFSESLIKFQAGALKQIERFRTAMNLFFNELKGSGENDDGEDAFLGAEVIQKGMNQILDNMESNLNTTVVSYLQEASVNRMSILERIRAEFQEDLNNISLQFHKWFVSRSSLQSKQNSDTPSAFQDIVKRFISQLNRVFGQFESSYNLNSPAAANLADEQSGSSESNSSSYSTQVYQYLVYLYEAYYSSSSEANSSSNVGSGSSKNETVLVV